MENQNRYSQGALYIQSKLDPFRGGFFWGGGVHAVVLFGWLVDVCVHLAVWGGSNAPQIPSIHHTYKPPNRRPRLAASIRGVQSCAKSLRPNP